MAIVPHVTSGLGLRKIQDDGFFWHECTWLSKEWRWFLHVAFTAQTCYICVHECGCACLKHVPVVLICSLGTAFTFRPMGLAFWRWLFRAFVLNNKLIHNSKKSLYTQNATRLKGWDPCMIEDKLFVCVGVTWEHAMVQLLEALSYKPEGCGLDSRWDHRDFSFTSGCTVALRSTQLLTKTSARNISLGGRG